MKLRSFIKRFKRVINLVSVLSNTSDYFLWIQAYLKLFIHSVLLGKIYILLTYLVFNVQFLLVKRSHKQYHFNQKYLNVK